MEFELRQIPIFEARSVCIIHNFFSKHNIENTPHPLLGADALITKRRSLAGSLIGGIKETQELLDFCAKHNVVADIELIPINKILA